MKRKAFLLLLCGGIILSQQQVSAEDTSQTSSSSQTVTVESSVRSSVSEETTVASSVDSSVEAVTEAENYIYNTDVRTYLDTKSVPEKLVVGEIGKIYPLKNSILSGAEYAFRYRVSDSSILSISDNGRFKAHKVGMVTVRIWMTGKDEDPRFDAELAARGIVPSKYEPAVAHPAYEATIEVVESGYKPTYRLYNAALKEHLYTTDSNEKAVLSARKDWNYEGVAWRSDWEKTEVPVYRLYNEGLKKHLYTKDANEYKVLQTRGWRSEDITFYSAGDMPVYRLYLLGLKKHLYTTDENEKNVLQTRGWRYEGIAWYSFP